MNTETRGNDNALAPLGGARAAALVCDWAREHPPGRFALCQVTGQEPDGCDAAIVGWGLAFPDRLIVQAPDDTARGSFASAERLLRVLGAGTDLRLLWIDEPG